MGSEEIVLCHPLINSAGIWSIPGVLCLFNFSIDISTSQALSWGISVSAACIFLPNIINPMYIQELREMAPPSSHNTVWVCNPITLLMFYYISSRLVTLLKVADAPIQVSYIFALAVSFKFINFSFEIFLLFVP